MKLKFFFIFLVCFNLSACASMPSRSDIADFEWSKLNPFSNKEPVTEVQFQDKMLEAESGAMQNDNALKTELQEIEMLTGDRVVLTAQKFDNAPISSMVDDANDAIEEAIDPIFEAPVLPQQEAPFNLDAATVKPRYKPGHVPLQTVETPQPPSSQVKSLAEILPQKQYEASLNCPSLRIMDEARSITKFDESNGGQIQARASLQEVKGDCDISGNQLTLDLRMIMSGQVFDAGRFEGNRNLEAFITFPYFITVLSPEGRPVMKDIHATALTFKPLVDRLDHAQDLIQTVTLSDIQNIENHTVLIGFQLSRKQLEYNRAQSVNRDGNTKRVLPDMPTASQKSVNPIGAEAWERRP